MNQREEALRTYKDQVALGMQDTAMNWHCWKRGFQACYIEMKQRVKNNVVLDGVINRFCSANISYLDCDMKKGNKHGCMDCGNYVNDL